jgi:hypothetical protein
MPAGKNVAKKVAEVARKSSRPKAVVKTYAEPTETDVTQGSAASTGARSAGVTAEVFGKTEKIPRKNDKGELVFPDFPEFRPNMTPKEVLQAGSFGGNNCPSAINLDSPISSPYICSPDLA